MPIFIRRWLWKKSYLSKLMADAFQKEAMSLYSLATVDDLNFLKDNDLKDKARLEQQIAELADETEYNKRALKKEYEKDLELVETKIRGRDRSIESMTRESETLKGQSIEMLHRREIVKKKFN